MGLRRTAGAGADPTDPGARSVAPTADRPLPTLEPSHTSALDADCCSLLAARMCRGYVQHFRTAKQAVCCVHPSGPYDRSLSLALLAQLRSLKSSTTAPRGDLDAGLSLKLAQRYGKAAARGVRAA